MFTNETQNVTEIVDATVQWFQCDTLDIGLRNGSSVICWIQVRITLLIESPFLSFVCFSRGWIGGLVI